MCVIWLVNSCGPFRAEIRLLVSLRALIDSIASLSSHRPRTIEPWYFWSVSSVFFSHWQNSDIIHSRSRIILPIESMDLCREVSASEYWSWRTFSGFIPDLLRVRVISESRVYRSYLSSPAVLWWSLLETCISGAFSWVIWDPEDPWIAILA